MGAFGEAQSAIDEGLSSTRIAVAGAALEQFAFVRGFVGLCDEGWRQGWHERNGGNASYRLTEGDVDRARRCFDEQPGEWVDLGVRADSLAGAHFLVTASGSYMQNIARDPARCIGIVELGPAGDAYRVVWGMRGGGRPTSEIAGHMLMHEARMQASGGASRVIYHAHPVPVIALSKMLPLEARAFTRALWRAMTECIMVFPEGLGVVGFEVPGSLELAHASAREMRTCQAVVWAHHGLLSSGADFDDAFGRMHAIVKAAEIYLSARQAYGGDDFPNQVDDDDLRAIAKSLGLEVNESILGWPRG